MSESGSADPKPELLFLCQVLPYPPDGGVYIRSYHVLRLLAERYQVTALCLYRRGQHPTQEVLNHSLTALRRFATVEAFPIPKEWSRLRFVWDHMRSALTRKVYTRFEYGSALLARRIRELRESHDFLLAHVDSLDLSGYFQTLKGIPIACTHHNIESALLRRRALRETSRVRKRYVAFQANLMEREERRQADRVALNIVVSEDDGARLRALAAAARVAVVTNGVDVDTFTPLDVGRANEIVFVGGLNWFPNLDGLEYFCSRMLPLIRARGCDAVVRWIGYSTDEQKRRYADAGIELTGYVPDIRPIVSRASCFVVPLRIGGGSRLKILDAWALGKAIVSTTVGAEGLRTVDGVNIALRDTPEDFADAVIQVLTNEALRSRLEAGGRATAEQHYGWPAIGTALVDAYSSLTVSGGATPLRP